jgi:hypothetical protein
MTTATTPRTGRRSSLVAVGLLMTAATAVAAFPAAANAGTQPCVLSFPITTSGMRSAQQCLAARTNPIKAVIVGPSGIRWI